ncbi:DNA gyrase inhibitor YacG [Sphingomonas sp. AX6]|uniref:DNA gyrase inhibitor YacG n=1 Tax=Sphingomonas sp. AX6 TaxID=2653171 RepID=UPI0012F3F423|nr:DNA gyrase inhibitor YacG [Sphingomonas sp. AX6]VXC84387.1 DNA gyrase inhibitor YacG [Sphingomonas sp. AX6]
MPRRKPCPICANPVDPAYSPFCSRGCRDRDLLKWLGDGYRIPAGPADIDPEGETGAAGLDTPVRAD